MHVKVDRHSEFVTLIAFRIITCAAVTNTNKILCSVSRERAQGVCFIMAALRTSKHLK